ncbi:hypothetical protein [Phenylobacterium sp.]|uniref:hypothetical protein n=1 Tax=Phenylobacterium sp. TaxID=1871053 RepID=UPI002F95F478
MQELLLYGLDEGGEPAFTQELRGDDRDRLRTLAQERLAHCHSVEVWDGPLCVIRLRRDKA